MDRLPPSSPRTATLFPYTTLVRSDRLAARMAGRADVDRPAVLLVRVGRLAEPVDQRKAARAHRRAAAIGDRLLRGDQIIAVDAIFDAKILPGRVRPAQRHRRRRGQLGAARGPHTIGVRHRNALRRPAEAREIGGLRSEEHTSELQSLMRISYAVFCLKKKKN